RHAWLLVAVLALGACTVGPDYRRPSYPTPASFRGQPVQAEERSVGDVGWWRVFEDETLQLLIRIALRENYDVRVAATRILDARAQVTVARSFQFPQVDHRASATYSRIEGERDVLQLREQFVPAAGFDLSFEIDFWGRFRRGTEAARADLLASEAARRFVITTLVSDVAAAYFNIRDLDLELEIARRTLASRIDSLRLVTMPHHGGVAPI